MTQASGHGEKRSRREDAALAALLAEPTITQAATKAGISESTLRGWLRDPAFQGRYRDARRQVVEQAVAALQRAASASVETLQRNLTCGVPTAEIAAAKTIFDLALRGLELLDMAAEVAELKRQLANPIEDVLVGDRGA
jgi:hypothetical protein